MGDDGFVVSDKTRFTIFTAIRAGDDDFGRIVKRHRLVRPAAERALSELADHDLVEREGENRVRLTVKGEEVSRDLKRQDALR